MKISMHAYCVNKTDKIISIDAMWDKEPWNCIKSLSIESDNDWEPTFKPSTEVKLCYDTENLYLIFRVKDQYIKCTTYHHNGPVWEDSCVEFFFSPFSVTHYGYFNIEINCCGYALMAFQRVPNIDYDLFTIEDIETTKIARTINTAVINEMEQPSEWSIEYKLPFKILTKYTKFPYPMKGDNWLANFYKCAENNSHPHWLSWARIKNPQPDFHLIQYMKTLSFG
ncbi:carbohydrate-binding family 9-like protein [candidate division KSB1 bacterium]|nr:carbohydrate-binding family 9-like protein [candidate division KSB1 bacterium]